MSATTLSPASFARLHDGAPAPAPMAAELECRYGAANYRPLPVTLQRGAGVWLFAIQHRFDDSRWARQRQWSFISASLDGSSYLKLPKILQWFTGNIGFHHVHHLAPRIPNYRLEHCYRDIAGLRDSSKLSLRSAFMCIRLALWDEERQCLVRFKDVSREIAVGRC